MLVFYLKEVFVNVLHSLTAGKLPFPSKTLIIDDQFLTGAPITSNHAKLLSQLTLSPNRIDISAKPFRAAVGNAYCAIFTAPGKITAIENVRDLITWLEEFKPKALGSLNFNGKTPAIPICGNNYFRLRTPASYSDYHRRISPHIKAVTLDSTGNSVSMQRVDELVFTEGDIDHWLKKLADEVNIPGRDPFLTLEHIRQMKDYYRSVAHITKKTDEFFIRSFYFSVILSLLSEFIPYAHKRYQAHFAQAELVAENFSRLEAGHLNENRPIPDELATRGVAARSRAAYGLLLPSEFTIKLITYVISIYLAYLLGTVDTLSIASATAALLIPATTISFCGTSITYYTFIMIFTALISLLMLNFSDLAEEPLYTSVSSLGMAAGHPVGKLVATTAINIGEAIYFKLFA